MFPSISQSRMLLYFFLISLLPIFIACIILWSQLSEMDELAYSLEGMQQTATMKERKQAQNMAVRNHFHDADHFYIDKNLETLTFLEPEIEGLQKLLTNKNLADDDAIKKRLELLTGPGNSMIFSEGVVQSSPLFQETTETLVHPVEINNSDLQKILAKIEGINIGSYTPGPNRPQLIILDFKLDKKNTSEKNEVFVLNLKLLKREFP